jgi:hypothetical protein
MFHIKVNRFEQFTLQLATDWPIFRDAQCLNFKNRNPNMLSVQNSEIWALSQNNPKTELVFPENRASLSKNRASLSQKPS